MLDLDVGAPVFDIEFHQELDLLGACSVSGAVHIYRHDWQKTSAPFSLAHKFEAPCSVRTLDFNDSDLVALGLQDGSVVVKELNSMTDKMNVQVSEESINAMTWLTANVMVSGDDDGDIRLWDCRQAEPLVATWNDCDEVILDLKVTSDVTKLYAAAGDKLSVFDLRASTRSKLYAMSDELETDILCLDLFKEEKRILCGLDSGDIGIYFENDYGDIKDRIPGVCCTGGPSSDPLALCSVDSVFALTDDIALVGCGDGRLYSLYVYPNKMCGLVGTHLDEDSQDPINHPDFASIDHITVDRHQNLIATASASSSFVRFHDAHIAYNQATAVMDRSAQPEICKPNPFFEDL